MRRVAADQGIQDGRHAVEQLRADRENDRHQVPHALRIRAARTMTSGMTGHCLSAGSPNMSVMIASVAGIIMAPPMPTLARAAISRPTEPENAAQVEPAAKAARPARAGRCLPAVPPGHDGYAWSRGPHQSRSSGGTMTTGQRACWLTCVLTEPITRRAKPPAPRDPSTIMSASHAASRSWRAG
jgi:hypothetical protein